MGAGSYTLLSLAIEGRAKRGRVKHEAPDGRTTLRDYSWPIDVTADQLATVLADLHRRWLMEPVTAGPIDPGMALVGKVVEPEG